MIFARVRFWPLLPSVLLAAVAVLPAGCGSEEGVTKTQVPKTSDRSKAEPVASTPIEPMPGAYRILGAMYPADRPQWFFKLVGPTDTLAQYEAGFLKLLGSVSLPAGGGVPEFTLPEGWTRGPGRDGIVVATVRTPDGKYEATVTSAIGGVAANLKRWAVDQLGNASFTEADVTKYTRIVEANGVQGLRTDLRGPKMPPAGPMMGGPKLPPNHP
jgi:hypothetical protein